MGRVGVRVKWYVVKGVGRKNIITDYFSGY
jgi:hypothetical protein